MRITGYYNPYFIPKIPSLDAIIISKILDINYEISFLIDTGAFATLLLDKDIGNMMVEIGKLKKSKREVSGVGGSIDTYVIEDAEIIFKTDEGTQYIESIPIFVGIHDLSKYGETTKKKILMMPSLLGRDIINKFDLFCSSEKGIVYLERIWEKE